MTLHFGQIIKENLETRNVSVREVVEKTGKHRQTVYSDFKKPSLNTDVIEQYCSVMNISFQELVGNKTLDSDLERQLSDCKQQLTFSNQLLQTKDELIHSLKAQIAMISKREGSSQTA